MWQSGAKEAQRRNRSRRNTGYVRIGHSSVETREPLRVDVHAHDRGLGTRWDKRYPGREVERHQKQRPAARMIRFYTVTFSLFGA